MDYLTWVFCRIYYDGRGSLEEYLKLKKSFKNLKQAEEVYLKVNSLSYSKESVSKFSNAPSAYLRKSPRKPALSFKDFLKQLEDDWRWLKENKIKILAAGEKNFPQLPLDRPVFCLYLWGDLDLLNLKNFSVVGARKASEKSFHWLDKELKPIIKKWDLITVSGGACGIDQKVHALSLSLERPTICFLPSGLREVYPRKLKSWIGSILENKGLLVSQFSPREMIRPYHFHLRNQLIAAVSKALFVVQGSQRGGTMMTANYALKIYRDIAALPFFPGEEGGGNLDLIANGATLLRDKVDLEVFLARNNYW